jgi:Fe-S cluster biosynthesis and repair protein YggX
MKLAVIKLGARIANKGTSGGSGEALSIIKTLSYTEDVHYFTKILKNDPKIEFAKGHNLLEEKPDNSFDALIVINGNVNFFGGLKDELQIENYRLINSFKGPIFYMYCDPELHLKQIWNSVEKKSWNTYKKNEIFISRNDIIYIHQPYNIEPFKKQIEKQIKPKAYEFFPFYKFPLLNDRLEWDWSKKIKDLGYGGTLRGGKREEYILEFLFGLDLDVEFFGPITLEKFKKYKKEIHGNPPKFGKAIDYSKFLEKMNEFKTTINIGDKKYFGNTLNQRIYEGVLSNNVSFIDIKLDPKKRAFSNKELQEFLYVNNKIELENKIKKIKDSEELCKRICERSRCGAGEDYD